MQMSARNLRNPDEATEPADPARHISHDCAGLNFYDLDRELRSLLGLYLSRADRETLEPHFHRLGALAGGRLDQLARIADKHAPLLNPRDAYGRDEDWIDYHPAYREMEAIAFGDFQFHAMSHRAGVLGMDRPLPAVAKVRVPVSVRAVRVRADVPDQRHRHLDAPDPQVRLRRAQGLSAAEDAVGRHGEPLERHAVHDRAGRRLGCRCDRDRGAPGWRRLASDRRQMVLFARRCRRRADAGAAGRRAHGHQGPCAVRAAAASEERSPQQRYRIVRLKDKLGTKSMASGEIRLDNAVAYLVGDPTQGLKQMMEQVNLSRLSHGVRAAAMMRRCVNEAVASATSRTAFGQRVMDFPLLRRQLMKLIVPTEQALSMMLVAARAMDDANAGSAQAKDLLRILTPLLKYRACRDNIPVATGAMEVRGGNGYIEEWVQPRLVRDAHVGVLWEGTSNINALDIITRAVGKSGAHKALAASLHARLDEAKALPAAFRQRLGTALDRAIAFAAQVAADREAAVDGRPAGNETGPEATGTSFWPPPKPWAPPSTART